MGNVSQCEDYTFQSAEFESNIMIVAIKSTRTVTYGIVQPTFTIDRGCSGMAFGVAEGRDEI